MPKPLVMAIVILGLGAGRVGADEPSLNPTTWRYTISAILDAQRAGAVVPQSVGAVSGADFGQRYERYSATGQPEATGAK